MDDRISESDRDPQTIEYVPPGANGELEPFVQAHNAHFVGLLLAGEFRRGRARASAVSYGTSLAAGVPLSSMTTTELAYYYNHLVRQEELDKKSYDLYEKFQEKKITAENIMLDLQSEEQESEEEKRLLQKLEKLLDEVEVLAKSMENLDRA